MDQDVAKTFEASVKEIETAKNGLSDGIPCQCGGRYRLPKKGYSVTLCFDRKGGYDLYAVACDKCGKKAGYVHRLKHLSGSDMSWLDKVEAESGSKFTDVKHGQLVDPPKMPDVSDPRLKEG